MPEITTNDIFYLAGLFDGEGCIAVSWINNKPTGRLSLTMSTEPIIDWLVATWGGTKRRCSAKGLKRPAYTWDLSDNTSLIALGDILVSSLKGKREQVRLLIELKRMNPGRGIKWTESGLKEAEELVRRIQTLNRR